MFLWCKPVSSKYIPIAVMQWGFVTFLVFNFNHHVFFQLVHIKSVSNRTSGWDHQLFGPIWFSFFLYHLVFSTNHHVAFVNSFPVCGYQIRVKSAKRLGPPLSAAAASVLIGMRAEVFFLEQDFYFFSFRVSVFSPVILFAIPPSSHPDTAFPFVIFECFFWTAVQLTCGDFKKV